MGRPLPEKIANAPVLLVGLELYWTSFLELNSCRSMGWSAGPIPFTAIMDYARAYEFSEEQTETLVFHISAMDRAYLDYTKRQREKEQKTIGKGAQTQAVGRQ